MDESYNNDPEFIAFMNLQQNKSKATVKQYRSNYNKLRRTLEKPIHETAQDTCINAINAGFDNPNTQAALLNVAFLVRSKCYGYPVEVLLEQRKKNKETIQEALKQVNQFIVLPSLEEFDAHIESLYADENWVPYVINHLIRYHYVRNKDLMFQWATAQRDITDTSKNYMLWERKALRMTWIRNDYKTAHKYGQKRVVLDNERLIMALKKGQTNNVWPLANDETKIGYHVQKHTFRQLGEGSCMKIIVNHYKHDINELTRISKSRGTDLPVLLTSYNIQYTE